MTPLHITAVMMKILRHAAKFGGKNKPRIVKDQWRLVIVNVNSLITLRYTLTLAQRAKVRT